MKVFLFDLMHYKVDLDPFKIDGELPTPLGKRYFDPKAAVETFAEHIDAWAEMERVGFDGIAVNEHHATPYGLMNSPNLLVAAAAQRTSRMKILTYGNLLPLHNPLRLAEELAMLDCMSNGRLIAGLARGVPREYRIYDIPPGESRARFDEGFEIMRRAWTDEVFSYEGQFYKYPEISLWPRPVQQPHPPIWVPVTGSKESIEWAARVDACITPGITRGVVREDMIRYYAQQQALHGRKVTPDKLNFMADAYVADSKAQAVKEYGAHYAYFFNTLMAYDHQKKDTGAGYYSKDAHSHLRQGAKGTFAERPTSNREPIALDQVAQMAEGLAWGTADEVVEKIIEEADEAGMETVMLVCNRGSLPQEMFLNQIRRLGEEVLPRLHAHKVKRVPAAEGL